jgi:predicted Zn finger-like uncharacterized protein
MSFVTRCPRCSTLFRVTPLQLQARAGKLRCGRCMQVFDGFHALAVEQTDTNDAAAGATPETAPAAAVPPPAASAQAHAPLRRSAVPAGSADRKSDAQAVPRVPATAEATPDRRREAASAAPGTLRRATSVALWASACALAGLLLVAQIAYVYRSELAARYPGAKSIISGVCDALGCSVPLPHKPDLVKIEASDVHRVDANRPQLIQLTATLRSYAGYYLAYPALDLVLTNANEHALARRIFVPREYLRQTRDARTGIPPNAEITIALDLDTGDLNAAGFRLDLLAAPAP